MPSSAERAADDTIRAMVRPDCLACGGKGARLYADLTDRFFGAAGNWNVARCSNRRCQMLWLDPLPLEQDIWKAYRNYYTHHDPAADPKEGGAVRAILQLIKRAYLASRLGYADRKVTVRDRMLGSLGYLDPTRRADTDFPIKYLPAESRGRLLDLGCGSGELLGRMQRLGWDIEGVDFDPVTVDTARRKGLKVRMGVVQDQKFPDAYFDAVVMSHFIEHVHQPFELLKEVRRILKKGRRLVMATPNAQSLGHRWLGASWPFLDPPRHLQVFTPRSLEAVTRAAGFSEVRVSTEIRTAAAMLPLLQTSRYRREPLFDGTLRPGLMTRIAGRAVEYGENLAVHFNQYAGEEIAVVAIR